MSKINVLFFSALALFCLTLVALERSNAQDVSIQRITSGQGDAVSGSTLIFLPITIGGTGPTLTPTATPRVGGPTNTPVPTIANTATAVNTAIPTVANTATAIPTVPNTATAVNTAVPTVTNTATSIPTVANTATSIPTVANTATSIPTVANTATPLPTATPIPTATTMPTATPMPTATTSVLNLPNVPFNYANPNLPAHFRANQIQNLDNTPNGNQITNDGATLGRVLFYDKNFSLNNTKSCASCHLAANGFSDPAQFSVGFEGGTTGRNSMGLANARYYNNGRFFWDERASTLEEQTLLPIQDAIELGMTLDGLVTKLEATNHYPTLFERAFGDSNITSDRIARALSQFIRSMVSYQARYDTGLIAAGNEDNDFANFTAEENRGKDLFFSNRTNCSRCHETAVFVGDQPRNNGLDATTTDAGEGGVNGNQNDDGKFKVPSLRNIELTAPYMHDGRLATLEEVIEHYNSGVQDHPNLDNRLRQGGNNGNPRRLNLSDNDKAALVAFLKTLTDPTMINDVKFSDPFTQ